ncbi:MULTISPECIES: sugar ABC transporter permease [Bacillaceae]|uniref:sugar ABC transporter permease n=1 Tax=Bacillaceae TaxID=186817 RepID=UPI000BEC9AEA|nr:MULTISPECIES: sugar ABC transporter permease [unclassified Bacillus (in: firmicutes)]PEC51747.1 ABC transporter permease [Bacillus sp. AFS096315]PET71418.1 ABC transporter permease [Bacillus sp. AFS001701]PFM79852.1 ABC transporter permease [Bacillus sp. AFS077874]
MNFFQEAGMLLRKNIREYGMYIALAVIMLVFTLNTDGLFMSSRNLSDLINMTGYVAVLAVGMTLVIVIRHIDLSVGFVAGFLGAVVALFLTHGMPVWISIIAVLVFGAIIGLINGFFVANLGIPSFVVSLAGMLIFKGLLLMSLVKTGTIIVANESFKAIGNGYIPSLGDLNGLHISTLLIGAICIILLIWSDFKKRSVNIKYGFEVLSMPMQIIKLLFISGIIGYISYILAGYQGISWTAVIMFIVVVVYHFITTRTPLGRHIYAVGGNPEAAQLSGISVKKITYIVFGSMSMLAALSGVLFTARLASASPQAGTMFELDAIAAAYVGGVSAAGGVGKVTGTIIGAFVMASLTSGMNLMGIDISYQYIIRGAVLVLAVVFDVMTRNKGK